MRWLIYFFVVLQSSLFAADVIGHVITLEGTVQAILEETSRILEKGSPIFALDIITLDTDSRAQILFTDKSVINLIPGTEFRVNSYRYRQPKQKDHFDGELLKGGFRYLSGAIAKKNPQEQEIKTPSATIGLLGTIVTVRMTDQGVFFGVEAGRAVLANQAGSVLIGDAEPTHFSLVTAENRAPQLLDNRPKALNLQNFSPPPGGIHLEKVQRQQQAAPRPLSPLSPPSSRALEAAPMPVTPSAGGESSESPSSPETPSSTESMGGEGELPMGGGASIQGGC